jgi:iron complex transport system substrate-binding protein
LFAAAALALAAVAAHPAVARELTDATGAPVKLAERPRRIVTLAPSLGELAADVADEGLERIVGVSEYTDYPSALTKVRSVGPYAKINLEAVVALKPDLVLATTDGNARDQVAHLRELGVPVVVVATGTLRQIYASIRLVGQAMGEPARGDRLARRLEEGVEKIRARGARHVPHRPVMLQIGEDPLVVAGGPSFLNEALSVVGARNVYADSRAHYPRPAVEDVLKRNPEVILVVALGKDPAPFRRMAAAWKRFPRLAAVQFDQVRVLPGDTILRPTLRMLDGLTRMERAIHADR